MMMSISTPLRDQLSDDLSVVERRRPIIPSVQIASDITAAEDHQHVAYVGTFNGSCNCRPPIRHNLQARTGYLSAPSRNPGVTRSPRSPGSQRCVVSIR